MEVLHQMLETILYSKQKVSALLAIIGKTYILLMNLISPDVPATYGFDAIVKLLDKHVSLKSLVIAKYFSFHKHDQKEGESISCVCGQIEKAFGTL